MTDVLSSRLIALRDQLRRVPHYGRKRQWVEASDVDDLLAALAVLLTALPPPRQANPLQSELLDLIVLMPDAQVDDLVGFITKLRDARRFNTRPQG